MSITAFPVLCRILTECKLLDTTVGVVVLSAGVGNDVVGWVLLALTGTWALTHVCLGCLFQGYSDLRLQLGNNLLLPLTFFIFSQSLSSMLPPEQMRLG